MPRRRLSGGGAPRKHRAAQDPKRERKICGVAGHCVVIALEDITAEVLVFHDVGELLGNVCAVHLHILFLQVRRVE